MLNPRPTSHFTLTPLRKGIGITVCGLLAMALALIYSGFALADTNQPATNTPSTVAANQRVVISDVLPNPTSGPEWVELYNNSEPGSRIFIPIVLNSSNTSAAPTQSGGVMQPAVVLTTNMDGWQLGNEDGSWYVFPDEMPPVPYGARVLIYFDGKGPIGNDYDFSDNVVELHTPPGLTDVFGDLQGQTALYASGVRNDETFRSRLAWRVGPANE